MNLEKLTETLEKLVEEEKEIPSALIDKLITELAIASDGDLEKVLAKIQEKRNIQ